MTGFNLDNYVDVPTRLGMALKKYPDLRIQETQREIIEMPDKSCFIRCTVTVQRIKHDLSGISIISRWVSCMRRSGYFFSAMPKRVGTST